MILKDEIIEAGKFLKPHGLKGELNAITTYDAAILESDYPIIAEMDGIYVPFFAESVRIKGSFSALVKFDDVNSAEEARRFVNKLFYLRKKDVAKFLECEIDELEMDEDYIGFDVYEAHLGYIGRVVDIDDSTENVLLEVELPEDSDADTDAGSIYIPFVDNFIDYIEDFNDSAEEEANDESEDFNDNNLDDNDLDVDTSDSDNSEESAEFNSDITPPEGSKGIIMMNLPEGLLDINSIK